MQEKKPKVTFTTPIEQKTNRKVSNLDTIISDLDTMGYNYIEGYVSNKKDKIKAIHRECGKERSTRFAAFSKQECRHCKREDGIGKYQKTIGSSELVKIIQLHSKGKGNVEIGNKIGFSNSAVRNVLIRNGLKSNIPESKLVEVNCKVCDVVFMPNYIGNDKACSQECVSELVRISKVKYTKDDINNVVKYKERKFTNKEIETMSKVDINKIKEITKEKGLFLSPEDAQANAYRKKLDINPNCMEDMRETRMTCTVEEYEVKMKDIIEILDDPNNKMPASYLCDRFGLNSKSIAQGLHKRGRSDLVQPSKTSKGEEQVADLVRECVGDNAEIIRGDRTILKPKELDIYIPSMNLAIEYCGIYWHNENSPTPRGRNYHYDKMKACEAQGIRLITIFSDDWEERQAQVTSFLMSVLGKAKQKVFARKCTIKEVEKDVAKGFLDTYHIQGKTTFKVAFGLYFEDELLGLISGSGHHRQKGDDAPFVLNRLVFKKDTCVVGGTSKLLKHLISYARNEGYPKIISWSDQRWSQGAVYYKTGFTMVEELRPDYSYVVGATGKRQSKQSNKKACLMKKGAIGTHEGNTERELALTLDLNRIYDNGKLRFEIDL